MGNQPSSEAYGESLFVQPPPQDRPLPPLPPPSTHASNTSRPSQSSTTASTKKLSKPQARSTAGLLKSLDREKGAGSRRFSASGIAQLVASSFSSPNTPTTSTFAAHTSSRPLPLPPLPLQPPSPGARSPSVFTFEEAVVAVTGQQNPAAWRPEVTSIYPTPSLDLELLQEQHARQLEFELRQRQNKIRYQQFQLEAQKQQLEHQRRRYSSFDPAFYDQAVDDIDLPDDEEAERRGRGRQLQKKKQRHQSKSRSRRRSLFRSKSSKRPEQDLDGQDDRDYRDFHDYQRRNSIGSVYYTTGLLSENRPPPAGSRSSWNYDLSSYAAKRLLHIVDDNPLDSKFERDSVVSESRYSQLPEVTWKSPRPVQPESPTLARTNSDLSLYAPVRRTSMIQVPGVASRRNSTSSFTCAGVASMRPVVRHSHPTTTPSLSRRTSFESNASRVLSMPPPLQRPELSASDSNEAVFRVSTPPDGEYNAIGTFKLGSLRITNGAESPMSSPEKKMTRKSKSAKEEPVGSSGFNAAERAQALAALSANDVTTGNNPASHSATITAERAIDGRQISPLSPALFQPPVDLFAAVPERTVFHKLPVREPVVSPTELPQIELSEDLFADFDFSSFSFEDTVSIEPATLRPAPSVATLQTTSKAAAVDDLLFEDDQSTLGFTDVEILDVRLDPNAKAAPKQNKPRLSSVSKSAHSMQSVSRSDSGFVSSPMSESSQKALSKADSGYSSNVSLRSFKQTTPKLMNSGSRASHRLSAERESAGQATERQSFVIDGLQFPSPTINTPEMAFRCMSPAITTQKKRKPLLPSAARPPPPKREAPIPPPPSTQSLSPENMSRDKFSHSPVSITMTDRSTTATSESSLPGLVGGSGPAKKRHAVPSPLEVTRAPIRSDSQASPKTSPIPSTPASFQSNGSVSALSIGSGTQRPSKFLRFLSLSNSASNDASANKGSPAVHATHIQDDGQADVPSVPSNINDKLREHTSLFPITTKRLALKTLGSVETRTGNDSMSNDASTSASNDDMCRNWSQTSNHRHTFQPPSSLVSVAAAAVNPLRAVAKRKPRLSMAVDFSDEFETDEVEETQGVNDSEGMVTPEPSEENKSRNGRRSWLRWGEDENRLTPTPDMGVDEEDMVGVYSRDQSTGPGYYNDTALGGHRNRIPLSRSSSIISRTMSLTAQLERSLSLKISKFARSPAAESPTVPISAFSTARKNQVLSPSLPSPLFAEAMEQQRRAMTPQSFASASSPVSLRMQQIRPSMLRVPPPLHPQSTPPSEAGSRRVSRQSSQDSLYNSASAQYYPTSNLVSSVDYNEVSHIAGAILASPPPLDSPLSPNHRNSEQQTGHDSNGRAARPRRGSSSSSHKPHHSFSSNGAHTMSMVPGGRMYIHGNGSQDGQTRVIRNRASFNGYSSDMNHSWDGGNHAAPQHHPQQYNSPRMSNGYTGPVMVPYGSGHRRNCSANSTRSDMYQLQQQQAWDDYYQQYARPPLNVTRSSHHRNRSMDSRHGPVPGPQAPYRILHSYNSPAYRGVPIWG